MSQLSVFHRKVSGSKNHTFNGLWSQAQLGVSSKSVASTMDPK